MAIEPRRGCGYRKVGGTYLVSGPGGAPCDRLPFPLTVCPVCSCGIKQNRGWTWVNPKALFGGTHAECKDPQYGNLRCPICRGEVERAGLLWIGGQFYKTPEAFEREAYSLGASRRIKAVPRDFVVGETWVLLAHPKAIEKRPEPAIVDDKPVPTEYQAGIFYAWRPTRIEKILLESQRGSEEVADLEKRGITPVFVPDGDKDHQGSVYDKEEEEPELPLATVGDGEAGLRGYDFE
jgi:hypothetical protein